MVAIIKKNFRLQNARDFIDNLKSHPRASLNGDPAPLEKVGSGLSVSVDSDTLATATYSWTYTISNTVEDKTSNSPELKKDSILGLKEKIGAHVTDRNHYLFIGKTTPWTEADDASEMPLNPQAELSPAPAKDTHEEERRVWDEMLGLKKITGLNASLVIPRSDWDGTGKTIYRVYDDRNPNLYAPANLDEKLAANLSRTVLGNPVVLKLGNFYALNSEYDLFVCIQTGVDSSGYPTPSTEEPRRTQSPRELIDYTEIDGYIWKYITTIKSSDVNKFLTDHWIPIRTLSAQEIKESQIEAAAGGIPDAQAIVQDAAVTDGSGIVLSCVVENLTEQTNSYTKTHKGVLSALGTNAYGVSTATIAPRIVAGIPGIPPSGVSGAYINMHLHITSPASLVGEVYVIESYTPSVGYGSINLTPGAQWSDQLQSASTAGVSVEYEILPIITTVSNGTVPVKLRPIVSNGRISGVKVVNSGKNATFVDVIVHPTSGKTSGEPVAKIRAVLSPTNGLGADPEKDLGAFFAMLTAKLDYNESSGDNEADFPLSNDYRQIGIIRDVLNKDGNLATKNTYNASKAIEIENITGASSLFEVDEVVKQTYTQSGVVKTAKARVIDISDADASGKRTITYVQTPETGYTPFYYHESDTTYSISSDRPGSSQTNATVTRLIDPEIKKFAGEILYLENRRAILRAQEQTEDIKLIVEF